MATTATITGEITERTLDGYSIPAGADRGRIWDTRIPGFGATIGRRRVSFVVQRRIKGDREASYVTLGHWAPAKLRAADAALRDRTMTVQQARGAAIEALGQMRTGEDPRGTTAPTPRGGPTLAAALAEHVAGMRKAERSARGMATIETETKKYLEAWLDRPLASIVRSECRARHDEMTEAHGPYVANRVMRHLRAVWNSAAGAADDPDDIPPCPITKAGLQWNKETRRQEPIAWPKLPAWRAAVDALPSPIRRDYNLIVLLTGLRRMDAATIRWEHVDWKARTLARPNPKGGEDRAFVVPLSTEAIRILRGRQSENVGDGGWAFPSVAIKPGPCDLCAALGLGDHVAGGVTHLAEPKELAPPAGTKRGRRSTVLVSPHRLRDTYTTALAALDPPVSPYAIDLLTNHRPARGSVTAGYVGLVSDDLRSAQERAARFLVGKMRPTKRR